jgi:exonuclease SbcC
MRLKKLTIHNIASFEDAEIDFEKAPLDNADVFLISGITGSGKSTILDAICMALYGKTPRIEESDTTSVDNKHDGISLTDARRFLRRNAGEGFVALQFEASGINFEARWGVRRAYNKPTGALQNRQWTLKDLSKNHTLTLESDIKQRIGELVGLDYDQFCRTTMLSQGEFDKFLRSKEGEKAEILQKITGADIFQRIGARIFAVTKQYKQEYDVLNIKLQSIKVLTNEEIEALNQQIDDYAKQIKEIGEQISQHTANRTWLTTDADFAKRVNTLTEELKKAEAEAQTDDFIAAKTDIAQYDATGTARAAHRQAAEQHALIANASKKTDSLRTKYANLLADCAAFNGLIDKLNKDINTTREKLADEEPRKTIYDAAGEICAALNNAIAAGKKAADYKREAEAQQAKNQADEQALSKRQEQHQKDIEALEAAKKSNDEAQAAITQKNVAALRKDKENAQNALTDIANAINAITIYKTNNKVVADITESLKKCNDDRAAQLLNRATAEGTLTAKKDALKSAEDTRNRQRDAAGDSAETLRSRLMPGDTCPVCGQLISDMLPVAEALREMLAAADEAYNKANDEFRKALEAVQVCIGKIKADDDNIAKYTAQLAKADAEMKQSREAMEIACGKTSVGFTNADETTANLAAAKTELQHKIAKLTEAIKQVDDAQTALNKAIEQYEHKRRQLEADADEINRLSKQQIENKLAVDKKSALADEQSKLAETSRNQAIALLGDTSGWDNNAATEPQKFIAELTAKKAAYTKLAEAADSLSKELSSKTMQAEAAQKAAARVAESQPQWSDIEPGKATGAKDIAEALNGVAADVKSASDSILSSKKTLDAADGALSEFYAEHEDIDAERLKYLAALSDGDVLALRNKIAELTSNITKRQGALNQTKELQAEHQFKRPEALYEAPDTTAEQLTEAIEKCEQTRNELTQQSGAITEKINANNQAIEQMRGDKEVCDRAQAVYERWKQLSDLLGDADGKKFRTIALSYVLNSLIRSANVYMRRLTDRYTLSVQPGTFIILVTDAYQGYVTRTANTISGGETFLVSLALALALSDLGTVSGIDTLFIDEGFGTLSGEPLQKAVETLRMLHSDHRRRVGIISHIAELRERIPVQIRVSQSDRTAASTLTVVP